MTPLSEAGGKMLPYNLVILGPQGSGKGTQKDMLSKKFGMPSLVAGDLIREKAEENNPQGHNVLNIINKGHLIPHNIVKQLFLEALKNISSNQTIIFDAWPRSKDQVEDFENVIKKRNVKDFKFLIIEVDKEESIKRISLRRVCEKCKTNFMPPESLQEKCPKCNGKLIQREDDYQKAMENRLKVYETETKPVIDYFSKQNLIIKVNGEGTIEEVFNRILNKLP